MVKTEVNAGSVVGFNIKKTGTTNQEWNIVDGQTVNGKLQIYDVTDSRSVMTFDGDGKVGIGTTSPSGNLHVVGASGGQGEIYVSDADEGTSGSDSLLITKSGTTSFIYDRDASSQLRLGAADNSGIVVIDGSNQRVGIGTTSPSAPLHVVGNSYVQSGTLFTDQLTAFSGQSLNINAASQHFTVTVNGSERARIDSSGRLGIGVSSPSKPLHIYSASDTAIRLQNSTTGTGTTDGFLLEQSGSDSLIVNYEAGNLRFSTANTERARIDSSGNLLVGNTVANPASGFNNQKGLGYTASSGKVEIATTADSAALEIGKNQADDGDLLVFRKLSTTVGSIGANGTYPYIGSHGTSGKGLKITDALLPATNTGGFNDADVNLGASNVRWKDLYLSGTARTNQLRLEDSGSTTSGLFHEKDVTGSGTSTNLSVFAESGKEINFMTNGSVTKAMTIDSSGNVLIGKTALDNSTVGIRMNSTGDVSFVADGNRPLVLNRKTSDGDLAVLLKDGSTVGTIAAYSNAIQVGQGNVYLKFANATDTITPANGNGTNNDNAIDLGSSSARFDDIYATNGTIQTSDRNEKQDIAELTDAETRVAVAAKGLLRKFRWQSAVTEKGDEARIHFGIIAQDLQDAFTAEGLDASDYGMFISSTWTDEETGEEKTRLGVRYSELLAFIIAAI